MLNRQYELSVQRNAFKNKSQTDFRRHGLLFLTMHLSSGQYECLFSSTLFTRLNSKKLVKSSRNTLHPLLVWWHNSTAQILIPLFRRSYIIFYPEYHSIQNKLKKIQAFILYQITPGNLSEQLEEKILLAYAMLTVQLLAFIMRESAAYARTDMAIPLIAGDITKYWLVFKSNLKIRH